MSQKQTIGQKTGVEANPVASDNIHGQTDSAGTGNQTPHVPISKDDGSMSTPRLTSALSFAGQSDGTPTLFSGSATGRTSEQDSMESSDSRERRWLSSLKPANAESGNVFTQGGNADVSMKTPSEQGQDISTSPNRFVPGQGAKAGTRGKDD